MESQIRKTISGLRVFWLSTGLLVVLATSLALEGRGPGAVQQVVAAARVLTGLTVLFFVPGVLLVPWVARRQCIALSALLGWAFTSNVVAFTLSTTVAKWLGFEITAGRFLGIVVVLHAVAGAPFVWRFRGREVANDFAGLGPFVAVGAVSLLVFAGLTVRPFLPSEHDYFSDRNGWQQLAAMAAVPVDLAARGATYTFADGWRKVGEHRYRPQGEQATIRFVNPGRRFTLRFAAIVQNYEVFDVRADFAYGRETLRETVAPGRFIRLVHRDNRQSNNAMVSELLVVFPGESELTIRFSREDGQRSPAPFDLLFHDFSNLDRDALLRRFSRRFMIGNTDDVRQHLSLARSLLVSPIPVDNTGNYYITDWPIHYYHNAFALALIGNRIETLWWCHWAKIVLTLAMLIWIACASPDPGPCQGSARTKTLATVVATLVLMNVTKALPIGDAAAYHDNTEMLLLAAMLLFRLQRRWPLFLTSACLASLTQHPTILLVGLLMLVELAWRSERRPMLWCLGLYVGFLVLCLIGLVVVGHLVGDWPRWHHRLMHDDDRRFHLVWEALRTPGVTIPYLLERSWVFGGLVMAMVGFLPVFLAAGCRRFSTGLLIATGLYLLPVAASEIHRIHHVSLPIVTFAAAGVHAVVRWPRRRQLIVGSLVVAASAACVAYLTPASRDSGFTFSRHVLYSSAPYRAMAGGLMTRAAQLASVGRSEEAIEALKRAAIESPGHRPIAYSGIAALLDRSGESAEAERWRRKARALSPRSGADPDTQ